jgi:hypothetical protein
MQALLVALTLFAAPGPQLLPVPNEQGLARAEKDVADLFGEEIAGAKKPAEKLAIVRRMLSTAAGTKGDPAGRYALFTRARDVAIEAGDAAVAVQAAEFLASSFDWPDRAANLDRAKAAWKEALGLDVADRLRRQVGAAELYLRAYPTLHGLERVGAQRRLAELSGAPKPDQADYLSLEDVRKLLRMDPGKWQIADGTIRGRWGLYYTPAGWSVTETAYRGEGLLFGAKVRGPLMRRLLVIGTDGRFLLYSRYAPNCEFWDGPLTKSNVYLSFHPGPRAERPGDWVELAISVRRGFCRFYYDGRLAWETPIKSEDGKPPIVAVGLGGADSEAAIKDVYFRGSRVSSGR